MERSICLSRFFRDVENPMAEKPKGARYLCDMGWTDEMMFEVGQ